MDSYTYSGSIKTFMERCVSIPDGGVLWRGKDSENEALAVPEIFCL